MVGLTTVSEVNGTNKVDGVKVPCEGRLKYRGYDIRDLAKGFLNKRFGFEECTYLLLFGSLPDEKQLEEFKYYLAEQRRLPNTFVRDVVMVAAGKDIMNSITRCILTLASYDKKALNNSLDNVISQCIFLISVFPMLTVYSYHAYNHYINDESMYIHRPDPRLSTAENILRMLRPDKSYTYLEATVLANLKVMEMVEDIKKHVKHPGNEKELKKYLNEILDKKAFDHQGLIYGMGHAVYTISDPRAEVFKSFVEKLASEKGRQDDYRLYASIEKLAPELILAKRPNATSVCLRHAGHPQGALHRPVRHRQDRRMERPPHRGAGHVQQDPPSRVHQHVRAEGVRPAGGARGQQR